MRILASVPQKYSGWQFPWRPARWPYAWPERGAVIAQSAIDLKAQPDPQGAMFRTHSINAAAFGIAALFARGDGCDPGRGVSDPHAYIVGFVALRWRPTHPC